MLLSLVIITIIFLSPTRLVLCIPFSVFLLLFRVVLVWCIIRRSCCWSCCHVTRSCQSQYLLGNGWGREDWKKTRRHEFFEVTCYLLPLDWLFSGFSFLTGKRNRGTSIIILTITMHDKGKDADAYMHLMNVNELQQKRVCRLTGKTLPILNQSPSSLSHVDRSPSSDSAATKKSIWWELNEEGRKISRVIDRWRGNSPRNTKSERVRERGTDLDLILLDLSFKFLFKSWLNEKTCFLFLPSQVVSCLNLLIPGKN